MKALRRRVLLKSPVRQFRTPGSLRGLLGNWQFYRDCYAFPDRRPAAGRAGEQRRADADAFAAATRSSQTRLTKRKIWRTPLTPTPLP